MIPLALSFLLLGLIAGILSGVIGIGGGVIILPALVFIFGLWQHNFRGPHWPCCSFR